MSAAKDNPWAFYGLPPFFTEQPSPATLERQSTLWHSLILDHAVYYSSKLSSSSSSCAVARVYDQDSDVFLHSEIKRRLPPDSARSILLSLASRHPNQAVLTRKEANRVQVLVATNRGGLRELEQSLLSWVLEMGEGTTTTMLAKKGAVVTFEEMAEQKALHYGQGTKPGNLLERLSSTTPVPAPDAGSVTEENAIRLLLTAQKYRSGSPLEPFAVTLFNLDGSDEEPYQGVKLGGGK